SGIHIMIHSPLYVAILFQHGMINGWRHYRQLDARRIEGSGVIAAGLGEMPTNWTDILPIACAVHAGKFSSVKRNYKLLGLVSSYTMKGRRRVAREGQGREERAMKLMLSVTVAAMLIGSVLAEEKPRGFFAGKIVSVDVPTRMLQVKSEKSEMTFGV